MLYYYSLKVYLYNAWAHFTSKVKFKWVLDQVHYTRDATYRPVKLSFLPV